MADALDSGSSGRKVVQVQVLFLAPRLPVNLPEAFSFFDLVFDISYFAGKSIPDSIQGIIFENEMNDISVDSNFLFIIRCNSEINPIPQQTPMSQSLLYLMNQTQIFYLNQARLYLMNKNNA